MGTPLQVDLGILGWTDSLILMVLALVVFGPRRLPQIGRQIGKLMYEFRKASNDFKFQMEEELRSAEEADRRKKEEERQRLLAAQNPPAPTPPPTPGTPYNEDVVYPPAAPAAAEPAAPAAATTEDWLPRILPPLTGEPVPAARPHAAVSASDAAPDAAGSNGAVHEAASVETPAPAGEGEHPVTEQTAQHG